MVKTQRPAHHLLPLTLACAVEVSAIWALLKGDETAPCLQRADVQVVNELYGSTIHLCYKKAGASLAVIQQVAEKTAENTAKQVRRLAFMS